MNRVKKVLVGSNTNTVTATAGVHINTVTMSAGDLLVLDADFKVLDQATALTNAEAQTIYIAAGLGSGRYKISSPIQAGNVTRFKATAWAAAVEQVSYIGYNTSTGDISADNSTAYGVRVIFQDDQRLIANRQTAITANYLSDATATKPEIVTGLIKNINRNALSTYVKAERVGNGALTELAADTTVTLNSTAVTSAGHGLTAGLYVSLRGITYIVASATTNAFVLDTPYLGASETIVVASTTSMAASEATPTAWGIKLTGKAIPTAYPNKYENVTFKVSLTSGFDTSAVPVTYTTNAFRGEGLPIQIREQEFYAQGQNGLSNRRLWPIPTETYYSSLSAAGYDQIVIEHADDHIGDMQQRIKSPLATHIAIVGNISSGTRSAQSATMQGAAANTGSDATLAILNAWVGKYNQLVAIGL